MNPEILIQSPIRRPQWRLDRVMEMIRHRPRSLRPRRSDDHYIRAYHRILLELAAVGEDKEHRDAIFREYPAVCQAHVLHYSADVESREILEARLLTTESFAEIAGRMATEPATIEYYEGIFFNVRDRLQHSGWISKVIRGPSIVGRGAEYTRSSSALRGYVLRLFAYHGGPLVLDAIVNGLVITTLPQRTEDLVGWFDDVLGQLVRSIAAAAASTLELNQKDMMQTVKLAVRASAAAAKGGTESPLTRYEKIMETVLASINWKIAGE
jgi:hypothetical protein